MAQQAQQQPQAATEFYTDQQVRKVATLILVERLWATLDPLGNWSEQFKGLAVLMGAVVADAQLAVVRRAQTYGDDLIRELGLNAPREAALNPAGFAGWNGDGRTIEQALGSAVAHAGQAFSQAKALTPPAEFDVKKAAEAALAKGREQAALMVSTALADTARAAVSADTATRDAITEYVRMLTPPSCSRCIVLAGKIYRWNAGFARHPGDDCIHLPVTVANADTHLANPDAYFHSLTDTDQDKIFGKAGAQAIRDGADISQVVNARQGMAVAQDLDGRKVKITTTGTTRRAWFGGGYAARKYGDTDWFSQFGYAKTTGRYQQATVMRLMPESIYEIAETRAEAVQMLQRYGFIL